MKSYSCKGMYDSSDLRLQCSSLVWRGENGSYWLQTDSWVNLAEGQCVSWEWKATEKIETPGKEKQTNKKPTTTKPHTKNPHTTVLIWKVYLSYKCKRWKVPSLDFMHLALTNHQSPIFASSCLLTLAPFLPTCCLHDLVTPSPITYLFLMNVIALIYCRSKRNLSTRKIINAK